MSSDPGSDKDHQRIWKLKDVLLHVSGSLELVFGNERNVGHLKTNNPGKNPVSNPYPRALSLRQLKAQQLPGRERLEIHAGRPKTRGDCVDAPRPCPWVSCRHHLFLEVNPETGSIRFNYPSKEPWELEHSCSLDLAERDGLTLKTVGKILDISRERSRQIEFNGISNLHNRLAIYGLRPERPKVG